MPELPEVETVRRKLEKVVLGRRIVDVECGPPSYFFITAPHTLRKKLTGQKTTALTRHGKILLLHLEDESRLLLHLGMTGQIVTRPLLQDGHVHLVLHLSGRRRFTFRDVRKFGKVQWLAQGKSSKRLDKLGPDALLVTEEILRAGFNKRKVAVKTALLNQTLLAGVGNIYADEALFLSGVRPTTMAGKLSAPEVMRLAHTLRDLLERAVLNGGSTINDYLHPDGELGGFQDWHQVYGKGGQPCPRCAAPIVREVVGGRSTHFCRKCQK